MDLLRPFEVGKTLLAECQEVRLGNRFLQYHRCGDFLAPSCMRNAETDGFGNRRMRKQYFINFARGNLLTATND